MKKYLSKILVVVMIFSIILGNTSVAYGQDTSTAPSSDSIYITNNVDQVDTIQVTNLNGGDIVTVYTSATGGRILGSITLSAYGTDGTIRIPQLGANSGSIYISVRSVWQLESNRVKVNFPAEPKSDPLSAKNFYITNNAGRPDTIEVSGLYGGETVRIYSESNGGRLLGSVNVSTTKTDTVINVTQLGSGAGSVYATVSNKGEHESNRTKLDYTAEPKSDGLSADNVMINNNAGKSDTVYITGLYGGESIKLYAGADGGKIVGTANVSATATEITINVNQLGAVAGSIYITVANKGELESNRVKVDYAAEPKTEDISADNVTITNNAGLADSIFVNYLSVGDMVKVYDAPKGGSILGSASVASTKTDVTLSIAQIGRTAGFVYITTTTKGMAESNRIRISFAAELKSGAPSISDITVTNNGGAADSIAISNLHGSDIVKIYDAFRGGNIIATTTVAASKTDATISVPQLGNSTGNIFVSVTSKGSFESDRTQITYSGEGKTNAPGSGNTTITNNSGKADTIYVINLSEGDSVKVYDSPSGGKLLGSGTVATGKTDITISVAQLGTSGGNVYIAITSLNKVESERAKVSYVNEPITDVSNTYSINVINNPTGKADTVQVYNLAVGDLVKVYDTETNGNLLGSATVPTAAKEATISISQLGASAGTVYVTVTSLNKLESRRMKSTYLAETKSGVLSADNILITNNKVGTADTIDVSNLTEGALIKVYSSATSGKLLGSGTVKDGESYVTISVPQLGLVAGSVYVSLTGSNELEGERLKADYDGELKSSNLIADNVNVKNYAAGTADIIEIMGLTDGDIVKVFDAARGGNLLGTTTISGYNTYATISVPQLGMTSGSIYITLTNKNKAESDRTKIDYAAESKSDVTTSDDITVNNNSNSADTVQVSGLDIGDVVKVYDALKGGNLLGNAEVTTGSYVTVSISQLGKTAGSVYVTVTKKNKIESDRITANYGAEGKSDAPTLEEIFVVNNVAAADQIKVENLSDGDVVNVYDSEKSGNILGTATVTNYSSNATVTVNQLGTAAGNIYVSVTRKGKQESTRTRVSFSEEPKSVPMDSSNVMIYNNAGTSDIVNIAGLSGGDVVNIYDAAKGGSLLGTGTVGTYDSSVKVTITQLGSTAGSIYISVTSKGKLEGGRIQVSYAAEQRSDPPGSGNITIKNNSGFADTVTVTGLEAADLVKIYDSSSNGILLGSGVVSADSTEVVISITQLGSASGSLYVAVSSNNKLESERTIAYYLSETTTEAPDSSNIKAINNVKIYDTVTVTFLEPNDVIKVYNAATGGSVLGTATVAADGTQATVSIKQLGTAAGTVYITIKSDGKKESTRVATPYTEEQKSDVVSSSNISVVNNAGMTDTVTVSYLDAGDVIKVYNTATGGTLLGSATVSSTSKDAVIKIAQLGYYSGYVYITITDYGKLESDRVKAYYTAEPVSDAPDLANVKITNNVGKSDTIYITGLTAYDIVKVYDSATGGSLLGTATVAVDNTAVTAKITQLGISAGTVYISVTSTGATESPRTKVGYLAE